LARDLRLARHYCDQILIHSLEGCVWQGFLPRLRSLEWADEARPPQRDQPLLLPVDMREWLPEDDLVFVLLDAVATLDLGEFSLCVPGTYAARRYSWITPPARSRRRTRKWSRSVTPSGSGRSGAAWFRVRCGRWVL
jgi:hypothetical protein